MGQEKEREPGACDGVSGGSGWLGYLSNSKGVKKRKNSVAFVVKKINHYVHKAGHED